MEPKLLKDAAGFAGEIASRLAQLASRTTPQVRSVRLEYSRKLAAVAPDLVFQIALRLVEREDFMCRFVGYEIVRDHRAAFANLTVRQIQTLGRGIDSWGAADCFACCLVGPAWRAGRLSKTAVRRWAQSTDSWRRRVALVSTVTLSRRGDPDGVATTSEICALLISDRHDMVVKALSWALRELANKDPREAERFLALHREDLAPRVTREVRNKIATGLKNPRRRQLV